MGRPVGGALLAAWMVPAVFGHSFGTASGLSGVQSTGYPAVIGRAVAPGGGTEAQHGWEYLRLDRGPSSVLGRWVFYRGSRWEGAGGPGAAIAADKVPLRAGQKAGFAHYTSYARGLNGLMVDLSRVPGQPSPADFTFAFGNSDEVAGWSPAPAPESVIVDRGAGVNGGDRIVLAWGSDAVKGAWLEVRVRATPATGLSADEIFYFGNAVGETGDRAGQDARVDASDEAGVRANARSPFFPASITDPYDFNRDRQVNATDQILARAHATQAGSELRLITPGVAPALASRHPSRGSSPGIAAESAANAPETGGSASPERDASATSAGAPESSPAAAGARSGSGRLEIRRLSGGRIGLRWTGLGNGETWRLEVAESLDGWTASGSAGLRDADGSWLWWLEPPTGTGLRFFRVVPVSGDVP